MTPSVHTLPAFNSSMRREDFASAVMEYVKARQKGAVDFNDAHVYSVTVLSPRPYFVRDKALVAAFQDTPAIQGYLNFTELYSKPTDALWELIGWYTKSATVIQVRYRAAKNVEPARVDVSLR